MVAGAANHADRPEFKVGQTKLRHRVAGALNQERCRRIRPAGPFGLNPAYFVRSKNSHGSTKFTLAGLMFPNHSGQGFQITRRGARHYIHKSSCLKSLLRAAKNLSILLS